MNSTAEAISASTRVKKNSSYAGGALSSVCVKTRLCKFYNRAGGCPRDRTCKFAHGEQELQAAPDLSHTKMCPSFLKHGLCKRGASCRYAHSDEELRPIVEVVPKPAVAAALLAAWQKSDKWSDFSTDDSDGGETQASSEEFGELLLDQERLHKLSPVPPASEVLVVRESFLTAPSLLKEGSRLIHGPTGMRLAIRNTFFDIDDGTARLGAARRCFSAEPRLGRCQPLV